MIEIRPTSSLAKTDSGQDSSVQSPVPVNIPVLGGPELSRLAACIESGWISSEGPFVAEFEQAMAARVGRRHGVAVSNGSVALDLALAVLGLEPDDEVII